MIKMAFITGHITNDLRKNLITKEKYKSILIVDLFVESRTQSFYVALIQKR